MGMFEDINGLLGVISNTGLGIAGLVQNGRVQRNNQAIAREQNAWTRKAYENEFAYKQRLQKELFTRDDNRIQRSVADAQLAGLSPLSALGSGTAGNTVGGSSSGVPTLQAEGMDMNGQLDLIRSMMNNINAIDVAKIGERIADKNTTVELKKIAKDYDVALRTLRQQAEIEGRKIDTEIFSVLSNISASASAQDKTVAVEKMKLINSDFEKLGIPNNFGKSYTDYHEFQKAYADWSRNFYKDFSNFIENKKLVNTSDSETTSTSSSSSTNRSNGVSGGVGLPVTIPGLPSGSINAGVTNSSGTSESSGDLSSKSSSRDYSILERQALRYASSRNPRPFYNPFR